jgi:phage FluMu protein Com
MIDVRCKGCGTKLLVAAVFVGAIKCKSCKKIFEYRVMSTSHFVNTANPSETKKHLHNHN